MKLSATPERLLSVFAPFQAFEIREVAYRFSPIGIVASAVDPSHVMLIQTTFTPGYFGVFEATEAVIGIDPMDAVKLFKALTKNVPKTDLIIVTDEQGQLNITHPKVSGNIPLISDAEIPRPNLPKNFELTNTLTLSKKEFSAALSAIDAIIAKGISIVKIRSIDGKTIMLAQIDEDERRSMRVELGPASGVCDTTFSADLFKTLFDAFPDDTLTLGLGIDVPARLFASKDGFEIEAYLAPRIDNDRKK